VLINTFMGTPWKNRALGECFANPYPNGGG
jgi:hypothetical protein